MCVCLCAADVSNFPGAGGTPRVSVNAGVRYIDELSRLRGRGAAFFLICSVRTLVVLGCCLSGEMRSDEGIAPNGWSWIRIVMLTEIGEGLAGKRCQSALMYWHTLSMCQDEISCRSIRNKYSKNVEELKSFAFVGIFVKKPVIS